MKHHFYFIVEDNDIHGSLGGVSTQMENSLGGCPKIKSLLLKMLSVTGWNLDMPD